MTQRQELKKRVLIELGQKLKPLGYSLNLASAEFTWKHKKGWNKYQLVFLTDNEGWRIKIGALIRVNQVEELYHMVSRFEPKYRKGTPTIAISATDYGDVGKEEYMLSYPSQISILVEELFTIFSDIAVPFFDSFRNVQAIDRAINETSDCHLTGSIYKGFKGIIVARLVHRTDYLDLVDSYRQYYESTFDGFYLSEYDSLVRQLNSVV